MQISGTKLIQGVGVNDTDYKITRNETYFDEYGNKKSKQIWKCPFYSVWYSIFNRAYSGKFRCYLGCSVHEDWIYFSKFKSWMEDQDWQGKFLDKDLLVPGNKTYGPNTCVFVSRAVNNFLTDRKSLRGDYPLGVYYHKQCGKYVASCNNLFGESIHLGIFDDIEEAHRTYKFYKYEKAIELASMQDNTIVSKALISRYNPYNREII